MVRPSLDSQGHMVGDRTKINDTNKYVCVYVSKYSLALVYVSRYSIALVYVSKYSIALYEY